MIGPFRAGRVNAVSGVVDSRKLSTLARSRRSVENQQRGRTWKPVFDSQSAASIGAIGVAPADATCLCRHWRSGHARFNPVRRRMYKSSDGGILEAHRIENTRQIGA